MTTRHKIFLLLLGPDSNIIRDDIAMFGSQNKIDKHRDQQTKTQERGTEFFVIYALDVASFADLVHAPDVQSRAVQ